MKLSSLQHLALVIFSFVMIATLISCNKKPQENSESESSALMQALDDWRGAGGVVNDSEISSGSSPGADQNAATFHQYLYDEVSRIPDNDLELLKEPWDAERSQIDSLAKYYATTIDQIKAATKVPNCDWGVDYSQGLDTELPFLVYMRPAARLLRADAIAKVDAGDTAGAVESLKCGLLLSRQVAQTEVPITVLLGVAVEAIMTTSVDELCKDDPSLSLSSLKPMLNSQDLRPLLPQTVMNDVTAILGEMCKKRLGSREAPLGDSIDPKFSAEIVECLNSSRAYAKGISAPLYQQSGLAEPNILTTWKQSISLKEVPIDVVNRNLGWIAIHRTFAKMAIGLREDKLRTGHYPDPSSVAKVTDPYDGGTIQYELNPDGGFTLTSSGTSGEPAEPIVWRWK